MGTLPCFNSRDPTESIIIFKELSLKLSSFNVAEIKNVYSIRLNIL